MANRRISDLPERTSFDVGSKFQLEVSTGSMQAGPDEIGLFETVLSAANLYKSRRSSPISIASVTGTPPRSVHIEAATSAGSTMWIWVNTANHSRMSTGGGWFPKVSLWWGTTAADTGVLDYDLTYTPYAPSTGVASGGASFTTGGTVTSDGSAAVQAFTHSFSTAFRNNTEFALFKITLKSTSASHTLSGKTRIFGARIDFEAS